jgi:hypothetical protein
MYYWSSLLLFRESAGHPSFILMGQIVLSCQAVAVLVCLSDLVLIHRGREVLCGCVCVWVIQVQLLCAGARGQRCGVAGDGVTSSSFMARCVATARSFASVRTFSSSHVSQSIATTPSSSCPPLRHIGSRWVGIGDLRSC